MLLPVLGTLDSCSISFFCQRALGSLPGLDEPEGKQISSGRRRTFLCSPVQPPANSLQLFQNTPHAPQQEPSPRRSSPRRVPRHLQTLPRTGSLCAAWSHTGLTQRVSSPLLTASFTGGEPTTPTLWPTPGPPRDSSPKPYFSSAPKGCKHLVCHTNPNQLREWEWVRVGRSVAGVGQRVRNTCSTSPA